MNYWLILVPLLSAFIGWVVLRLVIQLQFRPYGLKKILGISVQARLPAKLEQIANLAGKYVAREFSITDIEQKINNPQNFENVRPLIETHMDDFLRNKLKEQMPMISMFIGDKTIGSLKTVFIKEIETLFPQVIQQVAGNLKNEMNLEQLVSSKIAALSPERMEDLLYKNLIKEIHTASLFGAVIGFLIGLIQLTIILLTDKSSILLSD